MNTDDWVALIGGMTLFLGGVGGFVAQIINTRSAARKADLLAEIEARKAHSDQDDKEFVHLTAEIKRLETALDRRRVEIEQLFERETQLRRELEQVRAENADLRRENAALRGRITELEKVSITKPGTGPLPAIGD